MLKEITDILEDPTSFVLSFGNGEIDKINWEELMMIFQIDINSIKIYFNEEYYNSIKGLRVSKDSLSSNYIIVRFSIDNNIFKTFNIFDEIFVGKSVDGVYIGETDRFLLINLKNY